MPRRASRRRTLRSHAAPGNDDRHQRGVRRRRRPLPGGPLDALPTYTDLLFLDQTTNVDHRTQFRSVDHF